jgi:hypothetical protein
LALAAFPFTRGGRCTPCRLHSSGTVSKSGRIKLTC